jgi:hypothetical protein
MLQDTSLRREPKMSLMLLEHQLEARGEDDFDSFGLRLRLVSRAHWMRKSLRMRFASRRRL